MIACLMTGTPLDNGHRVFVAALPNSPRLIPLSEDALNRIPLERKVGDRKNDPTDREAPKFIEFHEATIVNGSIQKAVKKKTFVFSLPVEQVPDVIPELVRIITKKRRPLARS